MSTQPAGTDAIIRTAGLTKQYAGPPAFAGFGPPGGRPGGPPGGAPGARPSGVSPAVDGLDLEVGKGEIFGLLGPNGAGKSTTIGMLTTRVVPTSGDAFVGGIDVVAEPARVKQVIGVVTQTNTLDRSLSVYENLFFHGRYFGMSAKDCKAEANRLLEQFQLSEKASTDVNALSGGMAQRLMVARAILHRPAVLFLDEPTSGLDPQSRLSLWEAVRELNAAGQTILLTTHYMEEADQLCGRVAIMDHGRILALDTPEGLKRSVDADTIVTVTATCDLEHLATVLKGVNGVTQTTTGVDSVVVSVRGAAGILPRILQAADQAGIEVTDLSVAEPTLETVFITLTGKDLRD